MQKEDNYEALDYLISSRKKDFSVNYFEYILLRWLPFWPLLVAFIFLSLISTWGYLRYTPRVYQCRAQILIKEDKNKQSKDNILDALDLFGSQIKVENEIAILKSKYLMREVVGKLKLYAQLHLEGKMEKMVLYGENSPLLITAYKIDSIKSYSDIIKINSTNVIWGNSSYPFDNWCNTPAGVLKFTKGAAPVTLNKQTHYILTISSIKSIAYSFSGQLDITPVSKQSTVLQMSLTDVDMLRAQDVLNTLIRSYEEDDVFDKNKLAQKTIDFLNERLRLVSDELENVEGELQRFKQVNKAIDLTAQSQYFLRQLEENDKKSVELEIQLSTLKQVESYVNRKKDEEGVVPALYTLQDNLIKDVLSKLLETEFQYNKLVKSSGQNAPNTKIMEAQLEKYRRAINENLTEQKNNLVATNEKLKENNKLIQSSISNLPSKEKSLLDISRRQTVKDNLYSYLLQKREETQLSFASALADSRVIDAAESSSAPIKPQSRMIYGMGIGIALFVFIVVIGSFQFFGAKLMFKKELEMFIGLPIIASICKQYSSSSIVFNNEDKRSWISEQFRNFRTDIAFLGFNGFDKKVLLVTSSLPGEGKTFVALNLACVASLSNLRVVLVNADLRNSKLHEIFSISMEPGLTNYLAGSNSIDSIIYPAPKMENLFIIPSGSIPPNPSELLSNKRMDELIQTLKNDYDLIILDSTPCELVTDAKVVAKYSDASLIITRYGFTPITVIKKIKELIETGVLPNPSIVFNAVRSQGLSYGYGYGYGNYKYGYTNKKTKKDETIFSTLTDLYKKIMLWLKKKLQ
jgi:capsular exopolysaccharide synthesis family protein